MLLSIFSLSCFHFEYFTFIGFCTSLPRGFTSMAEDPDRKLCTSRYMHLQ